MNKLRIVLLATALLALPFGVRAFEWAPLGDAVDESSEVTSFVTSDGEYTGADVIGADVGESNSSFEAVEGETAADNTVDIYGTIDQETDGTQCPLKIDGDVTFAATAADLIVNIKTPVTIEPYRSDLAPAGAPEADGDGSLLIFETAVDKKITVNVEHNLTFRGITDVVRGTRRAEDASDLHITFKGAGQTIFRMTDGTTIKFDGQIDESVPANLDSETGLIVPDSGEFSANAGGTKVFVLMDQTSEQVEAGQNKVLFERLNNGDADMRTMIYVGPNSVFTYLSDNYEGEVAPSDAVPAGGKYYAAVGIDVSNTKVPTVAAPNKGTGRMVLLIKGAYKTGWQTGLTGGEDGDPQFLQMVAKYPFNDGAVVVAGHRVDSFDDPANFRTVRDAEAETTGYAFNEPAGVQAILRVVDNQAYTAATPPFAPTAAQRRGLLVINDCQSIGKYASDPYWESDDDTKLGWVWAYKNNATKNVRTGFVLGVNGVLDVYDSAFVDYVGGASNDLDYLAAMDYDNTYLKKRNASAFIVDGFDPALYAADGLTDFTAANASLYGAAALVPQVILRGNAKIMFKNAAVSSSAYTTDSDASTGFGPGYLRNFWARDPEAPQDDDLTGELGATVDFNMTLALGEFVDGVLQKAGYNGYKLAGLANSESGIPYTKTGEGEIVLDVEGPLSVSTVSNNTVYADAYAETLAARNNTEAVERTGVITLASVLTDYAGREINIADGQTDIQTYTTELVTRPLLYGDAYTYARYNSPGLFLNDKMSLYNTTFAHTDATKFVTGKAEESEPAFTGGERMFFTNNVWPGSQESDPDRYRYPEFRLFNSELALHETLCASGIRFVVMDDPISGYNSAAAAALSTDDAPLVSGSNLSVIRFYDHGQALDGLNTGYGRMLMLGSDLNLMEGSEESPAGPNYVTQSAFINVFKRNMPKGPSVDADQSSTVKLALRNGNEFPIDVETSSYERQRSQHYIYMAIPTGVVNAQTGIFLGWPTTGAITDTDPVVPVADDRGYPYKGEVLNTEDKEAHWFKLDAAHESLPAAQAALEIQGNNICWDAIDNSGAGALVPVKDANDNGNINVDFGGKFSITPSPVDVRTISTLNTTLINTNIAFRPWNDYDYDGVVRLTWYSGFVDLPATQFVFGDGYGTQPFGMTADMIDTNDTSLGFLRLPVGDEATLAWFYRDPNIGQLGKSHTAIMRPDYLMYVGSGSDVKQFRISGATANDPMYMDISGDGYRPVVARVREFATLASTRAQKFIGEGQHGIIFAEYGGRFGLGSTEWNTNSLKAWNILGQDYVTIAPLGHCTVDVNEDVIVADDLPFMATTRHSATESAFGDFSAAEVTADTSNALYHRMTIRSETEREVRVLRGTVLDLSGFGQGNRRQEIAFGGKIKLVIEEGGGIRFPTPGTTAEEAAKGGVVLYFNDESQLVFEGINEAVPARYLSTASSDQNRIKLLGKGQIWLNKNAKIKVIGTASVAVQADATTPKTDITISMQRQSQFLIGDANLSGGVFQVGNTVAVDGAEINFSLLINGADALFHTDREGFFGLGAGIINKPGSKPNGSASAAVNPQLTSGKVVPVDGLPVFSPDGTPTPISEDGSEFADGNAWQVIPLSNVKNITVQLTNGIIEHKNIFDGSNSNSSLWAVGPFSGTGTFKLNGGASAIVRGGGNLMLVPDALPDQYSYIPVNIWDYAGTVADTGETYGILASGPLMLQRTDITTGKTAFGTGGFSFAFTTPADLVGLLTYPCYSTQVGKRMVDIGTTQFDTIAGFINKDLANVKYPVDMSYTIRMTNPIVINGKREDGIKIGVVSTRNEGSENPAIFTIAE